MLSLLPGVHALSLFFASCTTHSYMTGFEQTSGGCISNTRSNRVSEAETQLYHTACASLILPLSRMISTGIDTSSSTLIFENRRVSVLQNKGDVPLLQPPIYPLWPRAGESHLPMHAC